MSVALDLSDPLLWQATSLGRRVQRGISVTPTIWAMSAYDTVALTTVTWFSYGDPQHDPPPTSNPVINVSATRVR